MYVQAKKTDKGVTDEGRTARGTPDSAHRIHGEKTSKPTCRARANELQVRKMISTGARCEWLPAGGAPYSTHRQRDEERRDVLGLSRQDAPTGRVCTRRLRALRTPEAMGTTKAKREKGAQQ